MEGEGEWRGGAKRRPLFINIKKEEDEGWKVRANAGAARSAAPPQSINIKKDGR